MTWLVYACLLYVLPVDAIALRPGMATDTRQKIGKVHAYSILRGIVEARHKMVKSVSSGNSKALQREGVLCFALTRSPMEETVPLLAQELARGCDAHYFFSHKSQQENNVIVRKAYSEQDLSQGWHGNMRRMVIAGAYTKLAEIGELDKYAWYVKVDTDTFVRSTLRTSLRAYTSRFPHNRAIIAGLGLTTTVPDGYFVAVSGNLMNDLLSIGQESNVCSRMVSGHSDDVYADGHSDDDDDNCIERIGIQSEPFLDSQKRWLMFADTEEQNCDMEDKVGILMRHFSQTNESLCKCFSDVSNEYADVAAPRRCYSPGFAIVHPVKSKYDHSKLINMFP